MTDLEGFTLQCWDLIRGIYLLHKKGTSEYKVVERFNPGGVTTHRITGYEKAEEKYTELIKSKT